MPEEISESTGGTEAETPLARPRCRPEDDGVEERSTSAKKLKLSDLFVKSSTPTNHEVGDGFVIVSMAFLREIVSFGVCPNCKAPLTIKNLLERKMGFSYLMILSCQKCDWKEEKRTSETLVNSTPGQSSFEINLRMIMGFREFGQGLASMYTLCRVVNMPPPMSKPAYNKAVKLLQPFYTEVAVSSMKKAAEDTKSFLNQSNEEGPVNCSVSIDGTWQRRGHASLNGVVTAIAKESGKCVDFQVKSKICKACEKWKQLKGTEKYDAWKAAHKCPINHKGSSGAMESAGAVEIFRRSIPFLNLRFTGYIGDGDSNSYASVVADAPYDSIDIRKLECVGHVQKRMGTRLRNLRKSFSGQKLSDGKRIGGKGRLTDKVINTIQNYYGLAIRQNVGQLYAMKKAVGAVLYHISENESNEDRHKFCPRSADSWCKFQADKITEKNTYKEKISLPKAIKEVVTPIFKDLSSNNLLERCLHGQTQNSNESLNKHIWQRCSKTMFSARHIVEIATASAVLYYNDGSRGLNLVLAKLGIAAGTFTNQMAIATDAARLKNMQRKSKKNVKKRRKKLRAIRKGFQDTDMENEGNVYDSGAH
eukprot:gene86-9701_t